ncbi:MAG: S8 family serine peptidase [Egicoccus sp.]
MRSARAPRTYPQHRRATWWRAAALTALAALAVAAAPPSGPSGPDDDLRVNVQVAPGTLDATAHQVIANGGTVTARLDALDTLIVDVADTRVGALDRLPGVVSVTPDGQVQLASPPATAEAAPDARSGLGRKLGLDFEGAYSDPAPGIGLDHVAQVIGADDLWARGATGRGIGVALLDSGVVPVEGLTAGNVRNGPDLSFESQIDALAHLDTYGHGTHMAGIIAGNDAPARNAAGGFDLAEVAGSHLGIAPDANLLSLKLATFDGATDVSQVMAAIDWVVQHKDDEGLNIRVLNLSFGTDGAQDHRLDPLPYAVEVAWRHGIVVVVSADTNHTLLPADDTVTDFSNRGDGVRNPDLVAPGRSLLSLRSPNSFIDVNNPQADVPARYLKGSGTSQSAAVVSGAVALLLQERPDLSPDQVKFLLTGTAQPVRDTAVATGAGMLDVDRASRVGVRGNGVAQTHEAGTGTGTLEGARGSMYLGEGEDALVGEQTILGDFDAATWAPLSLAGRTWRGGTWLDQEWTDACWCGSSWTGRTWRGLTWRGEDWSS